MSKDGIDYNLTPSMPEEEVPKYSDVEKAEALVALAINRGNISKASEITGISVETLQKWARETPQKGVFELLERAAMMLLQMVPADMKPKEWAIATAIILDKLLLYGGRPTARVENIYSMFSKMSDNELDGLMKEFEKAAEKGLTTK